MKKLLSSTSLAALTLCFSMNLASAMEDEDHKKVYPTLQLDSEVKALDKALLALSCAVDAADAFLNPQDEVHVPLQLAPKPLPDDLLHNFPEDVLPYLFSYLSFKEAVYMTQTDNYRFISWGKYIFGILDLDLSQEPLSTDIKNTKLKKFKNLTSLNLESNNTIVNNTVSHLPNLTDLHLKYNFQIKDKTVGPLINCTSLNLCHNNTITDNAVSRLINLTVLNCITTTQSQIMLYITSSTSQA